MSEIQDWDSIRNLAASASAFCSRVSKVGLGDGIGIASTPDELVQAILAERSFPVRDKLHSMACAAALVVEVYLILHREREGDTEHGRLLEELSESILALQKLMGSTAHAPRH
ncbi:MAG: hypothetical protein IT290_05915 [Deltaproteobacteria bacterium]|nr:hypothetical protein [Deltaproteobacteria bacterium]